MNDQINGKHVTALLNAYHDGELRGRKLDRVASHLEHCPECQQALAELDALSALLQSDLLPQISTIPEQFVAQVGLRLPRQAQASALRESVRGQMRRRWLLMPVGVIVMVWFVRAVSTVTNLLTGIELLGINPRAVSWLLPSQSASANPLQSSLFGALLPDLSFNVNLFLVVVLPLLVAGFFAAWLAWWWVNQEDISGVKQTAGS